MKQTINLPPERQRLFCSYAAHVTSKGAGVHDRSLGYVLDFLNEAEEISRKGYKAYRAKHSAELALYQAQGDALSDFMAFCGVKIGGRLKQRRAKAMERRATLDKKAQDILNGFAAWLVKENAYSTNTIRGYIAGAKDYLSYTTAVTTETARQYRAALEELKRAPKTINQRLNAIECLARYMGKNITTKRIKIPRTLSLENVPTEREVAALLDYLKGRNAKYYIWVRLLATTGARLHEFMQFTFEMVEAGHVDLRGKGDKVRRFFFSKKVQEECSAYAGKNKLTGHIAINRLGRPATARGVAQAIKQSAAAAGLPAGKFHPHAFRHFFAKMYLKRSKSKDVTELADLLGHSSLDTTMIYIKKSMEEQQKSFNKNVDW